MPEAIKEIISKCGMSRLQSREDYPFESFSCMHERQSAFCSFVKPEKQEL